VWKLNRQVSTIAPGLTLRVVNKNPFMLHWSLDDWATCTDTEAKSTAIGLHYVDLPIPRSQRAPVKFTFRWLEQNCWEGRDFEVAVQPG
jgi:glucoamylase